MTQPFIPARASYAYYRPGTQAHAYWRSHDIVAGGNEVMLELLYGENPITDDELRALIEKRPETYGRFAGYLGKRGPRS
jgi:hypothetical protein